MEAESSNITVEDKIAIFDVSFNLQNISHEQVKIVSKI